MRLASTLLAAVLGGAGLSSCAAGPVMGPVPRGLDLYMPVPGGNRLTAAKIRLGERLFHDRRLSVDGSIACATCHVPERAFSQARAIAIGVYGRRGTRNAPALINRAWSQSFFWDGRVTTLEEQVLRPIEDPNEMGSNVRDAARRVGLTPAQIANALAAFLRSVRSGDSAVDLYDTGDRAALDADARAGLALFRDRARCSTCHPAPLFSDEQFHNTGVAWQPDPAGGGRLLDEGRALVTSRDRDRGAFKTPTLRDVARTAPYMHDGSLATIEDVIEFYNGGGRPNPHLDPVIRSLGLTAGDKRALAAFLRSLSSGGPRLGGRGFSLGQIFDRP
jgi:cytochrome c peroxidase